MSFRDDLAGVLARDPRYTIHAYEFVFESLEFTKSLKVKARARMKARGRKSTSRHVSGRELCEGVKRLALRDYGLMAQAVLARCGIRSTSDVGNIVYNLIESGDFQRSPTDSRSDFDDVFDFDVALSRDYVMPLDEVA